jgi:hypothetical protein
MRIIAIACVVAIGVFNPLVGLGVALGYGLCIFLLLTRKD